MGYLRCAGGKATPVLGDPGIWYPAVTRAAGQVFVWRGLTITDATAYLQIGFDGNTTGQIAVNALQIGLDIVRVFDNAGLAAVVGVPLDATRYDFALALRETGCFYYWRVSGASAWTQLWPSGTMNTATLYPAIANYSAAFTLDRIYRGLINWLPTPLISDGFGGSNGALSGVLTDGAGHSEGIAGGLGSGGSGIAWHGYAWTVATNKAVCTPVLGAEDVSNGNMETGDPPTGWLPRDANSLLDGVADERTGGAGSQSLSITLNANASAWAYQVLSAPSGAWVLCSGWGKKITADVMLRLNTSANVLIGSNTISAGAWGYGVLVGRLVGADCRGLCYPSSATATREARFDDVSFKPMPISSLMSSVTVPSNIGTDCDIRADVVCTAGTQAGVCIADVSFHARINNAAGYGIGDTVIALDEVTQAIIAANDTVTIRGAADTTYIVASVGALANGAQTITLAGGGLVEAIADNVEIGVDYASWNGVMWYTDTVNAHMDVIALGVATANINTAATYAAGNTLVLWRNGTAFRGYQKDTFIGTQQTIAGINGPYVCMFQTVATNTIDNVVVRRVNEVIPGVME